MSGLFFHQQWPFILVGTYNGRWPVTCQCQIFFSELCVGLQPKQDLGTSGEVSHLLGYFGLMAAWDVGDRLFWFKEVTF